MGTPLVEHLGGGSRDLAPWCSWEPPCCGVASTLCKGRATLNSTWSGELSSPLWCSWLEKKVKPLWRPLWLRWPLWHRTSPTQTYLLAKEGNCGKQILRLVSSPRGDISPLPCSYFVTCALLVIIRPEYPPSRTETPALVYPLHLYALLYLSTCCIYI